MNALAIDCAVSKLTVAAKKENTLIKITIDAGIKQSEKLLPALDYVMKEAGLKASELDYTVCTSGPGTFTGLRLGISSLKALTLSHNIPLYAVPSLEAYAWPYKSSLESVISLIEAKEEEYFCNFFVRGEKLREDEDLTTEEILKQLDAESDILVCGPGALTFTERVNMNYPMYSVHCFHPENDACESLFEIAEMMIKEKREPMTDYEGPLYVRKSEAEILRDKKLKENT